MNVQYKDVTPIIAELVRLKNSIPLEIDVGRYLPEVRKNIHGEAVRSGLKKALRVIEQAPVVDAMPRWISVEERLPEDGKNVLIFVSTMSSWWHMEVDWRTGNSWHNNAETDWNKITHWMPLPEPPEVAHETVHDCNS